MGTIRVRCVTWEIYRIEWERRASFGAGNPKRLGDDPRVVEVYDTIEGNLEAAGVDLSMTDYKLGPVLEIDQATERFTNHDEANELLSRKYRDPWVIPNEV